MSAIDEVLENNAAYAGRFRDGPLPSPPSRGLAVVACMDARLMVAAALGLRSGEAHVIRNAGGIVNEETLRSLLISTRLAGTREIMVINHTDCGLLAPSDEALRRRLEAVPGHPVEPIALYAFADPAENVRRQVDKVRGARLLPAGLTVRGFVYDVASGRLSEVETRAG